MRLTLPYKRAFKTGAVILILEEKKIVRKKNIYLIGLRRNDADRRRKKNEEKEKKEKRKGWKDNILDDTFYVFVFIACASYGVYGMRKCSRTSRKKCIFNETSLSQSPWIFHNVNVCVHSPASLWFSPTEYQNIAFNYIPFASFGITSHTKYSSPRKSKILKTSKKTKKKYIDI